EWQLNYRGAKPMVVANLLGPLGLSVERHGAPARRVDFDVSPQTVRLDKNQPSGELTLVGEDGFGLRITQVLRFRADEYVGEARIKVENRHTVAQAAELVQTWRAPVEWPKDRVEAFQGQHPT